MAFISQQSASGVSHSPLQAFEFEAPVLLHFRYCFSFLRTVEGEGKEACCHLNENLVVVFFFFNLAIY